MTGSPLQSLALGIALAAAGLPPAAADEPAAASAEITVRLRPGAEASIERLSAAIGLPLLPARAAGDGELVLALDHPALAERVRRAAATASPTCAALPAGTLRVRLEPRGSDGSCAAAGTIGTDLDLPVAVAHPPGGMLLTIPPGELAALAVARLSALPEIAAARANRLLRPMAGRG